MVNRVSVNEGQIEVTVVDEIVNVNVCENPTEVSIATTGPQGPRGSQLLHGQINPGLEIGIIGDSYINTDTGFIFGPKTEDGWGTGVPLGFNDPADLGYTYTQSTASSSWNITHPLSFVPNILVVDSAGTEVEGNYQYIDENTILATFLHPFAGKAYLS